MDFKDMQYIMSVIKEGTVTKAAEKLFLSQPAISQTITKIENELGVLIFDKTKTPWVLTSAGKIFARRTEEILEINSLLLKEVDHAKNERIIVISSMYLEEKGLMPKVLPIFYEKFPDVKIKLLQNKKDKRLQDLEKNILNNQTDFSIIVLPIKSAEIISENIKTYEFILALPINHPLAKGYKPTDCFEELESIDISLLKDYPFVMLLQGSSFRDATFNICYKAGFTPNISIEAYNSDTAYNFVAIQLGATILLEPVLQFYKEQTKVAFFKIRNENLKTTDLTQSIALAYKKGYQLDDVEKELLKILRENA